MTLVTLGKSGLRVSPVGIGLAALGRPGYINLGHAEDLDADYDVSHMRTHAHAVLDAAYAAGVRYFDAARSYGLAEDYLGSWLSEREIDADVVGVGSKWGYTYEADWAVYTEAHEVKEHSVAVFERQIVETRGALGGHLGLYQIHSATPESGVLEDAAVLDAMAVLKQSGVAIGLSLSGVDQHTTLQRALTIRRDGALLFDCVQATWNLLEGSVGPALMQAREAGLGVIVKEGVANGRLTVRGLEELAPAARTVLIELSEAKGVGPDAIALAAVRAQPFCDVVLSGAATAEHLTENLKCLAVSLADDELAALAEIAEEPGAYWATRSRLPWN